MDKKVSAFGNTELEKNKFHYRKNKILTDDIIK